MKPAEKGRQGESTPRLPHTPITASVSSRAAFVFTASISGGAGNGINGMLRKEFYVVRKKYHVVRKLFYVASIFGGAAGRRNRPPWELSSTASRRRQRLQCVYRAPVFSRGAHTSLPDTNIVKYFPPWHSLFPALSSALRPFHANHLAMQSIFCHTP